MIRSCNQRQMRYRAWTVRGDQGLVALASARVKRQRRSACIVCGSVMADSWEPPSTLEEKLRAALVPPRLRMHYLAARERLRGEAEVRLLPSLIDRQRI